MDSIDHTILHRASKGDLSAFQYIYEKTSDFIYAIAYRIINNRSDAQDITQDVFVKLYQNFRVFADCASFKPWLYRIAVNTAINTYNDKRRIRRNHEQYQQCAGTDMTPPEVEARLSQEDAEDTLGDLLAMLPLEQRTVIVLREIEGLNYQQIAETLEININTVRTRLKRGRLKLMEATKRGVVKNELQKNL